MGICYGNAKDSSTGGHEEEEFEALIVALKKTRVLTRSKKTKENTSTQQGIKELALKPTKFYIDKIGLCS